MGIADPDTMPPAARAAFEQAQAARAASFATMGLDERNELKRTNLAEYIYSELAYARATVDELKAKALVWRGKPFADLTMRERAELKAENPGYFKFLLDDWVKSTGKRTVRRGHQ